MNKLIVGINDLATVNPKLAAEWDYTKNKKTPQDYTPNSNKKVWWKSVTGLSWLTTINHRSNGRGDPYLSGKLPIPGKTDLATLFPEIAKQWDYARNKKTPQNYTAHSQAKVWWKSVTGLSWEATINNRTNGNGDPYLSGRLPIPGKTDLATLFPEIAKQWDYTRNKKTPQHYTAHSVAKVWWKSATGLSWEATINNRTNGNGDPYLSGRLPIPGKTDLATVNPKLAAQWDYARNKKTPQYYTAHSHSKVWWISVTGLSWEATIDSRTNGRGDPYLSGKLPIPGKTDLATLFPEIAKQWDYARNKKTPQDYTAHSGARVWWKSATGLSWKATISNRTNGSGDPYLLNRLPIPGKTDLATLFPEIAKQWDYARNKKTPQNYTAHSQAKVWWKSVTGPSWKARIGDRTNGSGDPYLLNRLPIPGKTDLATLFPEIAKQWDYARNKKTPQDYIAFSYAKVWWICPECGNRWFSQIRHRTYSNTKCAKCTKERKYNS